MKTGVRVESGEHAERASFEGLTIEKLRSIIQDSHLNFLIGAGSSVPFFDQLGDIEVLLTDLGSASDDAKLARASVQAHFFEKVLLPNIELLKGETKRAKRLIESYTKFIAVVNRILLKRRSTLLGKQVNVFTTNVDMALEVALELLEVQANDGFSGKLNPRLDLGEYSTTRLRQGTRFEYRFEIPVVNLFKIHGSVGWKLEDEEVYFDHRLEQVSRLQELHAKASESFADVIYEYLDGEGNFWDDLGSAEDILESASGLDLDEPVRAFIDGYQKLSVVNPEKTKFASTVLNKTYYELIRRFANELEKENSVLFAHGFSFRDEHLRDLVIRAAATNPTLQVIIFCYNRASKEEIASLFPEERIKNGNVLFVQPSLNNDGKEEAGSLITLDVLVSQILEPIINDPAPQPDHLIELRLNSNLEGINEA